MDAMCKEMHGGEEMSIGFCHLESDVRGLVHARNG